MILLFGNSDRVYAVEASHALDGEALSRLEWLFSGARHLGQERVEGSYIGPRREMVTPWSTNAVEITQNMGIKGILRIEEFFAAKGADSEGARGRSRYRPASLHLRDSLSAGVADTGSGVVLRGDGNGGRGA